jgi:tRNA uridine 5-carbamoylmethylation protein Kti12
MTLIRGLPGSGKSTLGQALYRAKDAPWPLEKSGHWVKNLRHWVETDMFWKIWLDGCCFYQFRKEDLAEAHAWCLKKAREYIEEGVIVSNTFTTCDELRPYFALAKEFGVKPQVYLCQGQFENEHNVPEDVIARMRNRFEYDISSLYTEIN